MATPIGQTVRTYVELTKPRLLPLVLVTGLPALAMSAGQWPAFHTMGLVLLGIALYPDDAGTSKQLIERADRVALYAAKNAGRNRVVSWAEARDGNESLRGRPTA